ncbi:MAG: hypothetical protein AAF560_18645 [Acidobacteriota bacterium]
MSRLPAALEQEIVELGRFEIQHTRVVDQVVLTAQVRGVPVIVTLDTDTYPAEAPRLEVAAEWSWSHGTEIRGLWSQEHWNRTLGVGTLLRELEKRFGEEPPRRKTPRELRRAQRLGLRQTLGSWWTLFVRFFSRLLGRKAQPETTAMSAAVPDAIRARFEEIISDKTTRIERYKQAVVQLTKQWQRKTADLEEMAVQIQSLEKAQQATLRKADQRIEALKSAGKSTVEIKADAGYRRCREAYAESSAELEEAQERFQELETDAEEHLEKIRQHESQLELLIDELQDIQDEAAEVSADLITVELEQEIVDLRAGIAREDGDKELRDLMRQFRKAKAAVRITKEVADFDDEAQDAEYLEVARRVQAAQDFEESVGLAEAPSVDRHRE